MKTNKYIGLSCIFPSLIDTLKRIPKPKRYIEYGLNGMRGKVEELESVYIRMGVLAVLRSYVLNSSVIGVMVTASHNLCNENGIKMVDGNGGMLNKIWVNYATRFVNANEDEIEYILYFIIQMENINLRKWHSTQVWVARDTRSHSKKFVDLVMQGASLLLGTKIKELEIMTTPQLHYCIRMENGYSLRKDKGYTDCIVDAMNGLFSTIQDDYITDKCMYVDLACGVGVLTLPPIINKINSSHLDLTIVNAVITDDLLNNGCGADYVFLTQTSPRGHDKHIDQGKRWISFDGDVNRLVYHYYDENGEWHMLDGHKITILITNFILTQLEQSELSLYNITIGLIQQDTQYSSSRYKYVDIIKTEVKNLHNQAEKYDVGIYFDENGYGTVLFSHKVIEMLYNTLSLYPNSYAIQRLLYTFQLMNQASGDAITNLLLIEFILRLNNWNIQDWYSQVQ